MAYAEEIKIVVADYARRNSIKKAVRTFHISRNTVRRWYRERYQVVKPPSDEPELDSFFDDDDDIFK